MSFPENLSHLRRARNMTQEQLAMLLGVSRQAVSKWESRRSYPEMDKLVRLTSIFSCDLNDLVNGDLTQEDAHPELAVPAVAPPTDLCDYDGRTRRFAWRVASGVAAALAGAAGFLGVGGLAGPPTLWSCFFLALGLGIAAALAVPAWADLRRFRRLYPCIEDFYCARDRETASLFERRARRIAVASIAAGAACAVLQATYFQHLAGGLASAVLSVAFAAWLWVFAALMQRRTDVARYNRSNAERAELARIDSQGGASAFDRLAEHADPEAGGEEGAAASRALVARRTRRRRVAATGGILSVGMALGAIIRRPSVPVFLRACWRRGFSAFRMVGHPIL